MLGRLKDWRRIATRYDRHPTVFWFAIALAATVIFWLDQPVLALASFIEELTHRGQSKRRQAHIRPTRIGRIGGSSDQLSFLQYQKVA